MVLKMRKENSMANSPHGYYLEVIGKSFDEDGVYGLAM